MSFLEVAWVAAGGAFGAVARHAVTLGCRRWTDGDAPWATLAVNVSGCLALGLLTGFLVGREDSPDARVHKLLIGVGFLGAFTTYSTFGLETVLLFERGRAPLAVASIALQLVLGLGAAWLGLAIGRRLGAS